MLAQKVVKILYSLNSLTARRKIEELMDDLSLTSVAGKFSSKPNTTQQPDHTYPKVSFMSETFVNTNRQVKGGF